MAKGKTVKLYEKYDEDGDCELQKCPRCSRNLAEHENRLSCGNCHYTKHK